MADEEPKPRKQRSSAPLAAGVALLLGIPLAGFALKMWGPLLFPPDEAPRAVVEITGPRKAAAPSGPAAETRGSALDLVQGDVGAPAAPAPVAQAAPQGEAPPPAVTPAQPQEPAPPVTTLAPKYPKLRPNSGWKSWFTRQGLPSGVPDPVAQTQDRPQPEAERQKQTAGATPPPPQAAAAPQVSPALPAAKPAKRGYKPPAPVYSAADQANQVSAGIGLGTADVAAVQAPPKRVWTEHSTFSAPPDTAPQPNPEKAKADGSCPRRGWWKSGLTGMCYYTQAACLANGATPPCVQPDP